MAILQICFVGTVGMSRWGTWAASLPRSGVRLTLGAASTFNLKATLLKQRQEHGHVTPNGLLQGYRAVTLREREWNQRHAARASENTGVYVFTRVNASGISEFNAKWAVCGSRCGNARLLRRQRVESKGAKKDGGGNGHPGAADAAAVLQAGGPR